MINSEEKAALILRFNIKNVVMLETVISFIENIIMSPIFPVIWYNHV